MTYTTAATYVDVSSNNANEARHKTHGISQRSRVITETLKVSKSLKKGDAIDPTHSSSVGGPFMIKVKNTHGVATIYPRSNAPSVEC